MEGPYFSIPCFFRANGAVDYNSIKKYCKVLIEQESIHVLYTMAYNTRFRQLTYDEIIELNRIVCNIANSAGKKAVIGHPYTITSLEFKKFCAEVSEFNPYAVSVLYPERYYANNKPILDFISIPVQFGLGVMIHEQKFVSGFNGNLIDWPKDLLDCALSLEGVVSIKEDSKNDDITKYVFNRVLNSNIDVVVAGGGKRRLRALRKEINLTTWLNGSLMVFPFLSDIIIKAYLHDDLQVIEQYEEIVEKPFFDRVVKKFGWHVSHKAALSALGYCELVERSPMSVMCAEDYLAVKEIIVNIENVARERFMKQH